MKVLVCTSFTSASAAGEREAARRFPDAELVLFSAADPGLARRVADATGRDASDVLAEMSAYADQRMNETVERMTSQGHRAVAELVEGDAVDGALEAAARHEVSLIVVGAETPEPVGRFRTLLARRTRVPILFIPVVDE